MDIYSVVISVGIAPLVRNVVEYLKPAWQRLGSAAPAANTLASVIVGVVLAIAWQVYQGSDASVGAEVALGVLSGFSAVLYHDSKAE